MVDLALAARRSGPVALATDQPPGCGVSLSYLEQLFSRLRRARASIESTRGPGGGYTLGHGGLNEISVPPPSWLRSRTLRPADAGESGRMQLTRELWEELDRRACCEHLATVPLQSAGRRPAGGRGPGAGAGGSRAACWPPARCVDRVRIDSAVPNSVFAFGQSFRSS
jgi:hypothetical protein